MPAFFQHPSWKVPRPRYDNQEVSWKTGLEISCLPGSFPEDPRHPGTFQVDPDPPGSGSSGSTWKLPGNIQAGSSWPGRFQEGGTWKYPVRLEVSWQLPGNFQEDFAMLSVGLNRQLSALGPKPSLLSLNSQPALDLKVCGWKSWPAPEYDAHGRIVVMKYGICMDRHRDDAYSAIPSGYYVGDL